MSRTNLGERLMEADDAFFDRVGFTFNQTLGKWQWLSRDREPAVEIDQRIPLAWAHGARIFRDRGFLGRFNRSEIFDLMVGLQLINPANFEWQPAPSP